VSTEEGEDKICACIYSSPAEPDMARDDAGAMDFSVTAELALACHLRKAQGLGFYLRQICGFWTRSLSISFMILRLP
jgi:hypothetical protein